MARSTLTPTGLVIGGRSELLNWLYNNRSNTQIFEDIAFHQTRYDTSFIESARRREMVILEGGKKNTTEVTSMPKDIYPHERAEAINYGYYQGGGRFRFWGHSAEGAEGIFIPHGSNDEIIVSFKDMSEINRLDMRLVYRFNMVKGASIDEGYKDVHLFVSLTQFTTEDILKVLTSGEASAGRIISGMPAEGIFEKILIESSDGLIEVSITGVKVLN